VIVIHFNKMMEFVNDSVGQTVAVLIVARVWEVSQGATQTFSWLLSVNL
jgi:hypothetical protein